MLVKLSRSVIKRDSIFYLHSLQNHYLINDKYYECDMCRIIEYIMIIIANL